MDGAGTFRQMTMQELKDGIGICHQLEDVWNISVTFRKSSQHTYARNKEENEEQTINIEVNTKRTNTKKEDEIE